MDVHSVLEHIDRDLYVPLDDGAALERLFYIAETGEMWTQSVLDAEAVERIEEASVLARSKDRPLRGANAPQRAAVWHCRAHALRSPSSAPAILAYHFVSFGCPDGVMSPTVTPNGIA